MTQSISKVDKLTAPVLHLSILLPALVKTHWPVQQPLKSHLHSHFLFPDKENFVSGSINANRAKFQVKPWEIPAVDGTIEMIWMNQIAHFEFQGQIHSELAGFVDG